MNMSSAKRRLARNSPSIITPLFFQFNLLNMLSNGAVNSLGDMVSPCLTPLLILILFSLSLFRCTVTELSVYRSFRIAMYTSSISCSCHDINIDCVCTESNGNLFQTLSYTFMIHEHPAKSTPSELNTNSPKKCLKYNLPHIMNDNPAIVVDKIYTHSLRGFTTYPKQFLIQKYTDTCVIQKIG